MSYCCHVRCLRAGQVMDCAARVEEKKEKKKGERGGRRHCTSQKIKQALLRVLVVGLSTTWRSKMFIVVSYFWVCLRWELTISFHLESSSRVRVGGFQGNIWVVLSHSARFGSGIFEVASSRILPTLCPQASHSATTCPSHADYRLLFMYSFNYSTLISFFYFYVHVLKGLFFYSFIFLRYNIHSFLFCFLPLSRVIDTFHLNIQRVINV